MEIATRYNLASSLRSATSIMPHADLTTFRAMIRIGRLTSKEELALAVRAVQKAQRLTGSDIEVLIASDDWNAQLPTKPLLGVSCYTPSVLMAAINHYRHIGNLFDPCQDENLSHEFLHALASGVPLDGMNYRKISCKQAGEILRVGEALLGIH